MSEQNLQGDPAARVIVAGASGFAGALAAQLVWDHPRLELAAVTSRSDAGRRLDQLYPRYRVALPLTELDLEELEEVDAAIVAYPHAASAPVVAEMRSLGIQVVDLSADFRLRDPDLYEEWYGPHGEPALLSDAVYGLPELYRDQLRDADLVANPGCYPDRLAAGPGAARRSGPDRRPDDQRHAGDLRSRAGRGRRDALRDPVRERLRLQGRRAPPRAGDRAGACANAREAEDGAELTFVPHLIPLDQGELTTCFVTPTEDIGTDEIAALYEKRYADEPFVSLVEEPPGVRDVRDTNAVPRPRRAQRASGSSRSPRSTTSGRGPPARRSKTST